LRQRSVTEAVAIVGAGVAGCAAAIQLAEQGVPVTLYEAVAVPQPIGAGLLLQPTGQKILGAMGLLDAMLAHGAHVEGLFGDTPGGRKVLDMRYSDFAPQAFGLGVQRGALMGVLWQRVRELAIDWRCGQAVEHFEQDEQGVTLRMADGTTHRHAALILANGSFSRLRELMRVKQSAQVFPWGAVWTVLPEPEGFAVRGLRQRFVAARKMIGTMPVGCNFGESQRGVNLFWSLPLEQVHAWPAAGAEGLAALKREMAELLPLCEPLLAGLNDPAQLRQARYADVWMQRWNDGRVLAIGDCGHGMSPQLGQGANMALIDAHALAEEHRRDRADWPELFARYSQSRRSHLRYYTQASRALTPLFQSHQRLGPWLRDVVFGLGGRLPIVRGQSMTALTGYKTGWLYGRLDL